MSAILWSDEYAGPRFTYGLSYRPLSSATAPAGWLIGSNATHADYAFGTIQYPRPLSDAEVSGYQLTALS